MIILYKIKIILAFSKICFSIRNWGVVSKNKIPQEIFYYVFLYILMKQQTLHDIFSNYIKQDTLFLNKDALSPDYIPTETVHRDLQIKQLASILSPALKGNKISNIFIYGKTGTGKTLVTKYVGSELEKQSSNIMIFYLNCKMKRVADTEYRLIAELTRMLGCSVPSTGLPTDEIYRKFYETVDSKNKNIILILDEIDVLVKKIGDGVIYNLTRINQDLKNAKISFIGISNDITFTENLDPRVRSSLSEEEILFPPYNASQLKDILTERTREAFIKGSLESTVIPKCAALAAQEHGDARKALDLLRIAAELAEREGSTRVCLDHVDKAEDKLDLDRTIEIIKTQPKQSLAVLSATIQLVEKGEKNIQTGDIFDIYQDICKRSGLKILTQRRISDLISELDMLGIINTRIISKGRYGRTREIRLLLSSPLIDKIKKILGEKYIL